MSKNTKLHQTRNQICNFAVIISIKPIEPNMKFMHCRNSLPNKRIRRRNILSYSRLMWKYNGRANYPGRCKFPFTNTIRPITVIQVCLRCQRSNPSRFFFDSIIFRFTLFFISNAFLSMRYKSVVAVLNMLFVVMRCIGDDIF